jgi:hypothetical protein
MSRYARLIAAAGVLAVIALLSGCSAPASGPVIAPVTMNVNDLQGKTVDLKVGQVLNIKTGDLAGESYTGKVADTNVAVFVPAHKDDTAKSNPGVKAVKKGETQVVLSNSDGGIEDVTFAVEVDG